MSTKRGLIDIPGDLGLASLPSLAEMFSQDCSAEDFSSLPILLQQGLSVIRSSAGLIERKSDLSPAVLEQGLSVALEEFGLDECAGASLLAFVIYAQLPHVPERIRRDLLSLVELCSTKLDAKLSGC